MTVESTVPVRAPRAARQRVPAFGLSWRVLGLVVAALMAAELLIFLPSLGRFRQVYLEQLIESGTLAALALDATPDNMVTEQVKRTLLSHARVDTVVLVEPNKPKRALMSVQPRPDMPSFNFTERGQLGMIWDALQAMTRSGALHIRVGGRSLRLPSAMVWIIVDEQPMRVAMYGFAGRVLVLSIVIALIMATLLYLALRRLIVRPLVELSSDMTAFRRTPEEAGRERAPVQRNDEIGTVDREFQNLQRELRASLRQKTRLAEIGAATNKINHDLRNMLSTARLLSDRLAHSDDQRTRALAPTIMGTIDRAARLAGDALDYVRGRPTPKLSETDLADLVDEVGVALQEQGEERDPNTLHNWVNRVEVNCRINADRDLLYRVLVNLGRNAFDAGASTVKVSGRIDDDELVVEVADNGPGLPPQVVAHLFQPFVTGGRSGGAGLGLAIARDLIRAHDGQISLLDNSAAGATFRFTVPVGSLPSTEREKRERAAH